MRRGPGSEFGIRGVRSHRPPGAGHWHTHDAAADDRRRVRRADLRREIAAGLAATAESVTPARTLWTQDTAPYEAIR
jgi:hypothetical protein